MERATAGRVLEDALGDVYLNGAKPVPDVEADRVEQVAKDLRLSKDVCRDVFAEVRGSNQGNRACFLGRGRRAG